MEQDMMKLDEYASYDGLGLGELVARGDVTPRELAQTAAAAIAAINGELKAVIETYADRIEALDESTLGAGPFRGVPLLMKDVFGHEKDRLCEFGSRLCRGMKVPASTYFCDQLKAAGVNIIGRSAAPEYSMSATTESVMFGNTSNPWKRGYSAGGSSGGAQAAVTSGMVPIAHGSDIGGSIRIPASWCGGVGLKPSRGRVSIGPVVDEGGLGFSVNHIQAKTLRDSATMLDWVSKPQIGDPFVIPRPTQSYASFVDAPSPRLKIGIVLTEIFGAKVDPEVAQAVKDTAKTLEGMGHHVDIAEVDFGGIQTLHTVNDLFFFGFDGRLDSYAKRTEQKIGPDTLEPVILSLYEYARAITPARFFAAMSEMNTARRKLARFYADHDVWLSPTNARVAEPWGKYHLSKSGVDAKNMVEHLFKEPCQFTVPHNIMGTPALTLPLAMHSTGVPIGVQLAGRPAEEHVLIALGGALERAMPWAKRMPELHVSKVK
jgi:amidase